MVSVVNVERNMLCTETAIRARTPHHGRNVKQVDDQVVVVDPAVVNNHRRGSATVGSGWPEPGRPYPRAEPIADTSRHCSARTAGPGELSIALALFS